MGFVGSEATPNDQIMFSKETNVSPVQAVKGKFKETAKNKNDDIKKPKEELVSGQYIISISFHYLQIWYNPDLSRFHW